MRRGGRVPGQPDDAELVRVLPRGEWWHPDREALIRKYGKDIMDRLNVPHFPLDRARRVGQDTGTGGTPMNIALPDVAYARDLDNRRKVIALIPPHVGYWDEGVYDTEAEAEERVKALNRGFGVTSAQLIAMKIGSRVGFDVPGARPEVHAGQRDDEAGDSVAAPSEADVGVLFEFDPLRSRYANGAVTYSVTITKLIILWIVLLAFCSATIAGWLCLLNHWFASW